MTFGESMMGPLRKAEGELPGERILHRIAGLTLGLGFAAAAVAMALRRPDWAEGLAGGAVLGWLNFRWLRRGIRAMVEGAVAQAPQQAKLDSAEEAASGAKSAVSTAGTYFALLFRYGLVGVGVYVIFNSLHVPLVSIGLGLCALIAAIIAASVWEVAKPGE